MRRLLPLVLVVLAACASRKDASECPDPARESMSWRTITGVVTGVTSPSTLRLRKPDGVVIDVTIANVGERTLPNATEVLRRLVEGRTVTVFVNPRHYTDAAVSGEVDTARGLDVGNELLRRGVVAYVAAPAYMISEYAECLNRLAEREARTKKRGIWRAAAAQ